MKQSVCTSGCASIKHIVVRYHQTALIIINMGKYKRLGVNTLVIFIGNVGSKLIGLIMLPLYTRWLGPEQYGVSDILNTYVTVLLSIVTCSIAEALFVFPKDKEDIVKAGYFTTGCTFVAVMLTLTALVFGLIDSYADSHNSFTDNIWLLYLLLSTQVVQNITQQFVRSIDKIKVYSITGFVSTFFTAVLGCVFIPQYGLNGYIWSLALASIIGAAYSFFFSGSYRLVNIRVVKIERLKEMLSYCMPLVPSAVTWWVIGALNRPVMESYLDLHDIGVYAVASKFPNLLDSLFVIFGLSWQISVLEEYGKPGYSKYFNNAVRVVFTLIAIGVILLSAFSKQIITIFASSEFFEGWKFVPILTLGTLLGNFGSMFGTNFLATKKSKYMLYTSIWGSGAALILNFILIPKFGLWGAALSTVLSMLVIAITRIYYSWQFVKMTNMTYYIFTIILILSFITFYIAVDNVVYTTMAASVALFVIGYLNSDMIRVILEKNKFISKILNRISK